MVFKLLIVVSSSGFRQDFAKSITGAVQGSMGSAGIVFIGNSLYKLRRQICKPFVGLEGVALMVHKMSMDERGLAYSELIQCLRQIDDDELLDMMITSEKTICI